MGNVFKWLNVADTPNYNFQLFGWHNVIYTSPFTSLTHQEDEVPSSRMRYEWQYCIQFNMARLTIRRALTSLLFVNGVKNTTRGWTNPTQILTTLSNFSSCLHVRGNIWHLNNITNYTEKDWCASVENLKMVFLQITIPNLWWKSNCRKRSDDDLWLSNFCQSMKSHEH